MAEHSGIAWTHATYNPWWGCQKVSEECGNCYAERDSRRYGFAIFGPDSERRTFGDKHWSEPLRWARKARADGQRLRVFCASMGDVFEDHPALPAQRKRLWEVIDTTADALDWLLLTKRPGNVSEMCPEEVSAKCWVGTTAGTQKSADARLDALLRVKARLRFVSCEPLLEPVTLWPWFAPSLDVTDDCFDAPDGAVVHGMERVGTRWERRVGLDWVIAGGESGAHARDIDDDWVRSLRDECIVSKTPFFFKQRSGLHPEHTPPLDGEVWAQIPEVRR